MNEKMTDKKIRFFEEISSNAHVALNSMQYDGWLIRFANGHTNRANSVSVIYVFWDMDTGITETIIQND